MTYRELVYDDAEDEACIEFWKALAEDGISSVAVDMNTEVGSVTATSNMWRNTGTGAIGLRLYLYNPMIGWSNLAESSITDADYETRVSQAARVVLACIDAKRPKAFSATYSVDGEPIEA